MVHIDIVVAVRNEEKSILPFVESINSLNISDADIKLLFVEDGSTDGTLNVLKSFKDNATNIDYISLINPYGQGIALAWGVVQSKADAVITIDVDGSHPVSLIKEMVEQYKKGCDVVQGIRIEYKRDSLYRVAVSKLYFFIFTLITGINLQKQNVHFRLMNRKAYDIFRQNKSWWLSVRTNFSKRDNVNINYIPFAALERNIGESNYQFRRLLSFAFRSFLTLTSTIRFIGVVLIGILVASLLFYLNIWIGVLFSCLLVWIVFSYISIKSVDYSELINEKPTQ